MTLDIASPKFKADPFPTFARLRREEPVCRVPVPGWKRAWLVTRYDDVAGLLKDDRFAKDPLRAVSGTKEKQPWIPRFLRPLARNMLDVDPPDHTRLRAIVQKAFTPKFVDALEPRIRSLTEELLDRVRPSMDLIDAYALPLPATVIAEMLGIPASDRHRFHRWSQRIVSLTPSPAGLLAGTPAAIAFLRYIRRLAAQRRAAPGDDLLSALVAAEEEGDRLTADELVAMVFLLLIAGHETTVNLIGNGVLALLEQRTEWERLRADPGLFPSAVEELLRFGSPLLTATERYARVDVAVAGTTIPRGSLVYAALASANRDEGQFPSPDVLDVGRNPNRHLAFGFGVHYCLGAPLARLEGRIAIEALIRRFPALRLAVPHSRLRWRRGLVLRGLVSLPVTAI
ncbi:MAG: cytochrome P450 family protein [Thermoanaerobaculia bacterium]